MNAKRRQVAKAKKMEQLLAIKCSSNVMSAVQTIDDEPDAEADLLQASLDTMIAKNPSKSANVTTQMLKAVGGTALN